MSYDASPTWSGFNYQGKVALFHSLKEIVKCLDENVDFSFENFNLIVEFHEDFDIENGDSFISFHQVKAINDSKFSTYENALLAMILQLNCEDYKNVRGYLHTWKNIVIEEETDFRTKIANIINKLIDEYHDADDKSSTTIGKAVSNIVNKPKKRSAIIRNAISSEQTIDTEQDIIGMFSEIVNGEENTVLDRVEIYDYSNNERCCCINEISEKVKNLIACILRRKQLTRDPNAINRIFCSLLGLIDSHIIDRHNLVNAGEPLPISFDSIVDQVTDDNVNNIGDEYLSHKFKLRFAESFEEFINEEELFSDEKYESFNCGESLNVNIVSDYLLKLPALDLWEYYKGFSPHLRLQNLDNIDNILNANMEELGQSLFLILSELNIERRNNDKLKKEIAYSSGTKQFMPTTIAIGTESTIAKKILSNPAMIEGMFEVSTMISGENAPKINDFESAYNKCRDVDISGFLLGASINRKEKINEIIKELRLVPLSDAKIEVNND